MGAAGPDAEPGTTTVVATHASTGGHGSTAVATSGRAPARNGDVELADQAGVYRPPQVGPRDLAALPGAFTARQLSRVDEALTLASRETGLLFSLYVGDLREPTRATAEQLTAQLPARPGVGVILLAVSPGQRVLQIVTARGANKRIPNQVCALAALGMRAAFVGGDLTAGVINGLRMLADAAGGDTSNTNHP